MELAVEPGQRLVEQQHPRRRARASGRARPAWPRRRSASVTRAASEAGEADEVEHLGDAPVARRAGRRPACAARSATLAATSRCGNSCSSWNTMPMPRRWVGTVGDVDAVEARPRPASGRSRPAIDAQQRALAAARRSEQGDDLAVADGERRAVEHRTCRRTRPSTSTTVERRRLSRRRRSPVGEIEERARSATVAAARIVGERVALGLEQRRRCGRAAARWRSASSPSRCATGSWSPRTRRARSPRRGRRRRRAAGAGAARSTSRHARSGEAPSVAAASCELGVDAAQHRAAPCARRTGWRRAPGRSARATTTPASRPARWSNVISMPKPIVTADVAIGSISPVSSSRAAAPRGGDRERGERRRPSRRRRWRRPSCAAT